MPRGIVVVIGVVLLVIAIQFIPVDRDNPPATARIGGPGAVVAILERSCYDCHSNETRWPWYSRVAPVSWVIARDVREGREQLNFSRWAEYTQKEKARHSDEILDEVSKGGMPLKAYVLLHREAKMKPGDVDVLRTWVGAGPDSQGGKRP